MVNMQQHFHPSTDEFIHRNKKQYFYNRISIVGALKAKLIVLEITLSLNSKPCVFINNDISCECYISYTAALMFCNLSVRTGYN